MSPRRLELTAFESAVIPFDQAAHALKLTENQIAIIKAQDRFPHQRFWRQRGEHVQII